MSYLRDVENFSDKFGLPVREIGDPVSNEIMAFRLKFLLEELNELAVAHEQGDLPEMVDALVDLVYVALGTAVMLNLPFDSAWGVVHDANMSKQRVKSAKQSKRGSKYDLIKPPGWLPPCHIKFFLSQDLRLSKKLKHRPGSDKQLDLVDYINQLEECRP